MRNFKWGDITEIIGRWVFMVDVSRGLVSVTKIIGLKNLPRVVDDIYISVNLYVGFSLNTPYPISGRP